MRNLATLLFLLIPFSNTSTSAAPATDGPTHSRSATRSLAIFHDDLPGVDPAFTHRLIATLTSAGFSVSSLSAAEACDREILSSDRFFLYVIPQCSVYPQAGLETLVSFANSGAHILFLGGPFLDEPVWFDGSRWLTKNDLQRAKDQSVPQYQLRDPEAIRTSNWRRTCSNPAVPGTWDLLREGPEGSSCYRFWTEQLTGWDGYLSPDVRDLFDEGRTLVTFLAKGDPATRQIVIELQEQDGSRWMAVVDLDPQWRRVGLDANDFQYWPDSSSGNRRGNPGDRVRFSQVRRIGFQLARSHLPTITLSEHAFWIAELGTSPHPVPDLPSRAPDTNDRLETIFPRFKVYLEEETTTLRSTGVLLARPPTEEPRVDRVLCGIARTTGRGFRRDQKWRFMPILEAIDRNGAMRGHPAWLLLNHAAPFPNSVFACLGMNQPETRQSSWILPFVTSIAERISTGVFLREAGSEHFAYWPGEPVRLGAQIVNVGRVEQTVEARLTLRDSAGDIAFSRTMHLTIAPGKDYCWQDLTATLSDKPTTYRVTTVLLQDETVCDQIEHDIQVLNDRMPSQQDFLTVNGNDFYSDGRKWYPVGVNYWPLYVSGMNHPDFQAGWLQQRYYDPNLVEDDLARMSAIGINLVSIQSPDLDSHRNLLDFLHRCRKHNLKVNLFCGLASPLAFREEELRQYIDTARLKDNPTIMAYDTIWEPGNYVFQGDRRRGWDQEWRDWVIEQYGAVEAAEREWKLVGRKDEEGRLISPPDEYFQSDGPWRIMMAAYRRFMDDATSRRWNRAHRKLRELDPNHLVSFRQGNTLPHDFVFTGTPKHVDFICPEGYAIPANADGAHVAGFITRYLHFTTGGKPIVWSEFGQSVWDAATMSPSRLRIQQVADYHEMFYQMVLESGANGTIPWWWPGGYRVGEQSDFGIVNPNGMPRPAAQLIAEYGPQLKVNRDWPTASVWLEMDRDAHAGGYWYTCFHTGRDAYRHAVEGGENLGIRTAGTGTNSATTPLIAVGNRPCTGANPPKFLNAEFNWLRIQDAGGRWIDAEDGQTVQVSAATPIKARVCVGNTQEATWLAPRVDQEETGSVFLQTTAASELSGRWPLRSDTPYLGDADFGEVILSEGILQPTKIELRMQATGRSGFGEKRTFVLTPQTD